MKLSEIFSNHRGYENRISRQELCRLTGYSDSTLRIKIAELRLRGIIIVSSHIQKGYFELCQDTATAEDYRYFDAMISDMSVKLKTQQAILESQSIDQYQLTFGGRNESIFIRRE